jgi:hypothetical protein
MAAFWSMLVFVVISDNGKVCVLCEIFLSLVNVFVVIRNAHIRKEC